MKKKDYYELLSDPRWQRKRLEIMHRDDFTCQHCGAKDKTINVHHKYYFPGNDPWDYANNALITLCNDCHEFEHDNKEIPYLMHELNELGFTNKMIEDILRGILIKLVHDSCPISDIENYYVCDRHYSLEKNISVIDYINGISYGTEE